MAHGSYSEAMPISASRCGGRLQELIACPRPRTRIPLCFPRTRSLSVYDCLGGYTDIPAQLTYFSCLRTPGLAPQFTHFNQ